MRVAMVLGVAGVVLMGAAAVASAQTYQTNTNGYAPIYVSPGTASSSGYSPYTGSRSNAASIYNQQQAVPGVNAPSYNYNTTQQGGPMTAAQAMALRAQRDQQAQQYQQQYFQQGQQMLGQTAMGGAVSNMFMPQEQPVRKKKRLVKREEDNPLSVPPRLFSID